MKKIKYMLTKILGHIVRYGLCALTIDKINITESYILSYCVISPIITFILWKLSYYTCKKVVCQKLDINESTAGSIGYTVAYVIYLMIGAGILIALKHIGVIPFANEFDIKFINGIAQWYTNLMVNYLNKMVQALQGNI